MRRSLPLPYLVRNRPLLAAATLALLTGCAQNGTFNLSNPLAGLLGGKSAQTQGGGSAEPAAQPTIASAPTQRASTPATQVAAANPVTPPKPAPVAAKPAAPPIKDMGFFGNFEIGAGFGAQKASGIGGILVGLNDGENPNRLKVNRKVQTLEGEEYTLEWLGKRLRSSNRDTECVHVQKPHHRIKVKSTVFVKFSMGVEIQGPYLAGCALSGQDLPLELLPGDYEVYVAGSGDDHYTGSGTDNYTLTLTEVPPPYSAEQHIIVTPGFKQLAIKKVVTLPPPYRKSPMARPVTLTVTAPMWLNISATNKNVSLVMLDNAGKEIKINSQFLPVFPFEKGEYKIYAEVHAVKDAHILHYDRVYPELTDVTVSEATNLARNIVLDRNFTAASFSNFYYINYRATGWLVDSVRKCFIRFDDVTVHKLIVTVPQQVEIYSPELAGLLLIKPGERPDDTCKHNNKLYTNRINVFLAPGEYELYAAMHASSNRNLTEFYTDAYNWTISSSNKQ